MLFWSGKYTIKIYYHDNYGLEADAVLQLKNGDYALIEIKLGSKEKKKGLKIY